MEPLNSTFTRRMLSTLVLVFLLPSLALSSGKGDFFRSCQESDVCEAIVFNQLALAEIREELRNIIIHGRNCTSGADDLSARRDLSKCLSQNRELHSEVTSLEQKNAEIMSRDESQDDEKDKLRKEAEKLRVLKLTLEAALQKTEDERSALEAERSALELERSQEETVVQNLAVCEREKGELEREKTRLDIDRNNMEKDISDLQREKAALERGMLLLEEEKSKLGEDKSKLEIEKSLLSEEILILKEAIKNLTLSTYMPKDCADIQLQGQTESGAYDIYPYRSDESIEVLCDLDSNGGGWTIFFNRQLQDEQLSFNENWENFKNGFGNINAEYWLGNDIIHEITSLGNSTLRIDAEDFTGERRWAEYNEFFVADEYNKYKMDISGYSDMSTMGDSLSIHNAAAFTTFDNDNDKRIGLNCAVGTPHSNWGQGGWWYNACGSTRPTAPLKNSNAWDSACWQNWDKDASNERSFKTLSMKIRRNNYEVLSRLIEVSTS